jgi:hypothetical protein
VEDMCRVDWRNWVWSGKARFAVCAFEILFFRLINSKEQNFGKRLEAHAGYPPMHKSNS